MSSPTLSAGTEQLPEAGAGRAVPMLGEEESLENVPCSWVTTESVSPLCVKLTSRAGAFPYC